MISTQQSQDKIIYAAIAIFIVLLTVFRIGNQTLGYGVETDFLSRFVPEAERFLAGEPLKLEFHPPLYPITLASVYLILGDWILAGILLSLLSSMFALIFSYHFVKLSVGRIESVGVVLILFLSWGFIKYSMLASGDMFFLAIFYCGLMLIVMAENRQNYFLWGASGICLGLGLLARTNGLPMMSFLLFPFAVKEEPRIIGKILMTVVCGMMIPVLLWIVIANLTESPLYVVKNYANLAASYFSNTNRRSDAEAVIIANQNFSSLWQVICHDPLQMGRQYIVDFFSNTQKLFMNRILLPFPLNLFALPGLIFLFYLRFDRFKIILLVNLAIMFLFLNLHPWVDRYYLFAVPVMGASIAAILNYILTANNKMKNPIVLAIFFIVTISYFSITAYSGFIKFKSRLATDTYTACKVLAPEDNFHKKLIIGYKPHLRFFTKSEGCFFPNVNTIDELRTAVSGILSNHPDNYETYIFYGDAERRFRSQFIMLEKIKNPAPWLKKIAAGNQKGGGCYIRC